MLSVLVVSPGLRFLELLGEVLREAGIRAVCVEDVNETMQVIDNGFRPQAVVLDPAAVLEPGGNLLAGYLAHSSVLARIPVLSLSAAILRREVTGLLEALRHLGGGASACA